MNKITEFFLYASGADGQVLEQTPTDKIKYVGVGGTVIFTGIFAAMAASYTLFTVFDSYIISGALGVLWGLMIFNLDRFIVSSMRKKDNFVRELLMALPRIVLAVVISLVIAKPFELKIFAKEIEPELVIMEQEVFAVQETKAKVRFEPQIQKIGQEIQMLQNEIAEKAEHRDGLLRIAQEEADGTGGSKRKNLGPIYRVKKAHADKAQAELNELTKKNGLKIAELQAQMSEAEGQMNATLNGLERAPINGPAARMQALGRLTEKSNSMWWAHIFIILLFLMIESSPILVKLISERGPYDSLLQMTEHEFRCREVSTMAARTDEAKQIASNFGRVEQSFVSRKLDLELK